MPAGSELLVNFDFLFCNGGFAGFFEFDLQQAILVICADVVLVDIIGQAERTVK